MKKYRFLFVIVIAMFVILPFKVSAMEIRVKKPDGKDLVVSSKWYGKVSTVLFYVAIFCSMIIEQFGLPYNFDSYIYYVAIMLTVFSLVMYVKAFYIKGYLKKDK